MILRLGVAIAKACTLLQVHSTSVDGSLALLAPSEVAMMFSESLSETMKPMTVRDLKNATAEVVRALRKGETILLMFRGRPLATIEPLRPATRDVPAIEPHENAWRAIESELKRTKPHFRSWKHAEGASRGRR